MFVMQLRQSTMEEKNGGGYSRKGGKRTNPRKKTKQGESQQAPTVLNHPMHPLTDLRMAFFRFLLPFLVPFCLLLCDSLIFCACLPPPFPVPVAVLVKGWWYVAKRLIDRLRAGRSWDSCSACVLHWTCRPLPLTGNRC
mmetsp:Transcript_46508/g.91829  ORF Transcript_46508/g.91829 Transcript_46508/m.91829 type:complete len:139 (+) Transcript_46508:705-1121(+)